MKQKRYAGYITGIFLVLLGVFIILTFNSLVKKEEAVKKQWAEVQNTYQRRLDLVPSLVNVVKGVSDFEQSTLEKIVNARADALNNMGDKTANADSVNRQQQLQDTIASATNRVIAIIEKYPTLKGTAAYTGLQVQLEGTERRIKVARNNFNKAVNDYNRKVRLFPSNMVAGIFGFKKKDGFVAVEGSDKAVEITFNK